MCDTTLEESDPFLNLELDIEAGINQELSSIRQELLSILTKVETPVSYTHLTLPTIYSV